MPLDKIRCERNVDQNLKKQIEELTGGAARLALDLLNYDPKYEPAMRQVFGSTFVCDDSETAKKICFNPKLGFICVTLEGDKYEPSGALHGGSAPQGGNILLKIDEFIKSDEGRVQKEQELFQ